MKRLEEIKKGLYRPVLPPNPTLWDLYNIEDQFHNPYSWEEKAKIVGPSSSTIRNWVMGRQPPKVTAFEFYRILDKLGVTFDVFIAAAYETHRRYQITKKLLRTGKINRKKAQLIVTNQMDPPKNLAA